MEKSLVLVKPDAMERGLATEILSRIEGAGLKLVAMRMLHMDRALAERHYAIHRDKSFFRDLVDYITSTPVVAAVFEGEDAVARVRRVMGATDPAQAEEGTIRRDYGLDIQRNSTHASDSVENAEKEISLFFRKSEMYS
jgi:nucleoside-diphosphate kinase